MHVYIIYSSHRSCSQVGLWKQIFGRGGERGAWGRRGGSVGKEREEKRREGGEKEGRRRGREHNFITCLAAW